jgi:hypothetical protein
MSPAEEVGKSNNSLKDGIIATITGLDKTINAKLDGIRTQISSGFADIRTTIDKQEQRLLSVEQDVKSNSINVGINTQTIKSFKWVIGIVITICLANLACLIKIITGN